MNGTTKLDFILFFIIGTSINNLSAQVSNVDSIKETIQNHSKEDSVYNKERNSKRPKSRSHKFANSLAAADCSIFIGYGKLIGNVSKYFTDPVFIGANIDFYKNRVLYQIDVLVAPGTTLTKKTMTFPNQLEWKKHDLSECVTGGFNIGYKIIDNKYLTLVPLIGAGIFSFSSGNDKNRDNEPIIWSYKIGLLVNCKFLSVFHSKNSYSYNCVRFSLGLTLPIENTKYPQYYKGSMLCFTLGIMFRENSKHKTKKVM